MRSSLIAAVLLFTGCVGQIDDSPDLTSAAVLNLPSDQPAPVFQPPPADPVVPATEPTPPVTEPTTPPVTEPTPPSATGSLALAIPGTALTLHLNESKSIKVTVTPKNGFSGTATFAVTGLPAGITATFIPATAALTTAPVDVTLTLRSRSDMMGALGVPLAITTNSGAITSSSPLTLDLLQEVLIQIAPGVALGTTANPNTAAFGAVSTSILFVNPGTKVTFINMDTRNHEVHAPNNTIGMKHEPSMLLANGANSYSQVLTKGSVNFRCHIHPNMLGQIVVR